MDKLPDSLLLQILSRLDDSADVARCRVASKAFDTVFPGLRSINLACSLDWYKVSSSSSAQQIKPLNTVLLDLISKLETVESVCIHLHWRIVNKRQDFYLTDDDFAKEWLPRVSNSLKSLSLPGFRYRCRRQSNVLPLISAYCHHLVYLSLSDAWLSVQNLNPMLMLTTLTLDVIRLEDENLSQFNKCFPNLQALELLNVKGLKNPKIHLLNLKACVCDVYDSVRSFTLITPNLITLEFESMLPVALHVEAPMLSYCDLGLYGHELAGSFTAKKFENLKTLQLNSACIDSLLSQFPITKTVEYLKLESVCAVPRDTIHSKLTLTKVFTVFPNVTYLCINSRVWSELEACLSPQGWEILDGSKGLKTIQAYLMLTNPSLTFSYVARVLDQCISLSEVLLLIHGDVVGTVSYRFMSMCMARWPGLKWRWGKWSELSDDSWITD